jgi:endonuclease/exonuclease/phosphatase family metal-dependent hydrolase
MASISLVSLNIERSKHLDRVISFLKSIHADVICLQELSESDIPRFESELAMTASFAPFGRFPAEGDEQEMLLGVGILTRTPAVSNRNLYYKGDEETAKNNAPNKIFISTSTAIVMCDLVTEGEQFRILSTHFTWTPDGKTNEEQRTDMQNLLATLKTLGDFILCGDFNAPRGGEIFSELAHRYTDNIPSHYSTSLDIALHRLGKQDSAHLGTLMVDGLFTTPRYFAENVSLQFGVSDHAAIVATISTEAT